MIYKNVKPNDDILAKTIEFDCYLHRFINRGGYWSKLMSCGKALALITLSLRSSELNKEKEKCWK